MKKIFLLILAILVILWGVKLTQKAPLKSPEVSVNKFSPSASPSVLVNHIPKSYTFDKSTDLKKELESINPQVLDTDFE